MRATPKNLAHALFAATKGASPAARDQAVTRFSRLLIRERAGHLVPRIIQAFEALDAADRNVTRISLEHSAPVGRTTKATIAEKLGLAPENVEWLGHEQPTLISGARARTADRSLRISLADRLQNLKEQIV